ncbi:uncharacterized protein LOC133904518 [Phragmites australis]|uniref:uncharacterized protein LOC133904518 n=1 Tax=Phragmites australis TaxID=29695 RepID=UPI002D7801E1|nr:uncharacterized protein LOC133904518 [Phragmites australis]
MGIDADGLPMDGKALNRFRTVAGLIAQERVLIMTKFEDHSDEAKRDLFDNVVKEYLEYPRNMSERQTIAALNACYLMANSDSRIVQQSKFIVGDMRNLDEQLHVLKRTFRVNRFLIVLENVDLHNMQMLQIALQTQQCEKKGSKITVTSNKNRVTSIGTAKPVKLKILPLVEYWFFFRAHAFAGADMQQSPRLVAMGRKIYMGLQGSFFDAKIVGTMLRTHPTAKLWSKFLRNVIGELSLFGDGLGYMYDVAETILPNHARVWHVAASVWWPDNPGRTLTGPQDLSLERSYIAIEVGLPFLLYYTAHCTMVCKTVGQ